MGKTEVLVSKTLLWLLEFRTRERQGDLSLYHLGRKKQNWVIYYSWIFFVCFAYSSYSYSLIWIFWIVVVIRSRQAVSLSHELKSGCLSCLFHLVGQCLSISTRTAVQVETHLSWASASDGFRCWPTENHWKSMQTSSSRHSAVKSLPGKVMVLVLVAETGEKL